MAPQAPALGAVLSLLVAMLVGERGWHTRRLGVIRSSATPSSHGELLEDGGEDDHVHLLVAYPPKTSISALVNSLKGVSARLVRARDFPEVRNKLWGRSLWSPSYCAVSAGGASLDTVRVYIEQQRA